MNPPPLHQLKQIEINSLNFYFQVRSSKVYRGCDKDLIPFFHFNLLHHK